MRLSTDPERDDAGARSILARARAEGIAIFDTARTYFDPERGPDDVGHNERLLRALLCEDVDARMALDGRPWIVTKCGMVREGARYVPDGRAKTILADARASREALGAPCDVLLLHAPDPSVPLLTSVRALVAAREEGLARSVGLSNVTRKHLAAAADVTPLGAVSVALGPYDDKAARGGVVAWCEANAVPLLAHAPFGGPSRAARLANDKVLGAIGARLGVSAHTIVLAYLLALSPVIVPVVGVRRVGNVRQIAAMLAATTVSMAPADRAALDERFPGLSLAVPPTSTPRMRAVDDGEIVILMGIAGAGKSRLAEAYVACGYARLNRDSLGGTLAGIARRLTEGIAAGGTRFVLDNTYVSRASRSEILRLARARGIPVRCVFVDTPTHEAEINVAVRMIDRHGIVGGDALRRLARRDPGLLLPGVVARMARDLEPPAPDEGFAAIETVSFRRDPPPGARAGVLVPIDLISAFGVGGVPRYVVRVGALDALAARLDANGLGTAPILVFGWSDVAVRGAAAPTLEEELRAWRTDIDVRVCGHPAGGPTCWCRPPYPAFWIGFARRYGLDPGASFLVATTPMHGTMARKLGLTTIPPIPPGPTPCHESDPPNDERAERR